MAASVEKAPTSKEEEKVHRSVRVFAVTPISTDTFCELIDSGVPIGQISLAEVILAQKADTKLVTGIGGEIKPGEDLLAAAQSRVFEKTLLTRESRRNFEHMVGREEAIPYTVRNFQDTYRTFVGWLTGNRYSRQASLAVMPVRGSTSIHEPREEDDGESVYKVKKLVHVTPKEFETLLTEGSVQTADGQWHRMMGHLTQASSWDVFMSQKARAIQRREFDRVLDEVNAYETRVREEMKMQINRVRVWHGKDAVTNLKECDRRELERGFLAAQWVMGMADEQLRDKKHTTKPAKPADLFTSALYLWAFAPEDLPDGLFSAPTREVLHVANVVKHALRAAVIELYERMGEDITPCSSDHSTSPQTIDAVAALTSIWPDVLRLAPEKHVEILGRMDERIIQELVIRTHKPYNIIKGAMEMPDRLPRHLAEEMSQTKDTFQEHHPTNEAASAIERPFVQLLHILGLHPYREITDATDEAVKHTRGEILMQEAIIFASIAIKEEHERASNVLFEMGIASFFEPPKRELLFLKGIPHRIYSRRTVTSVGGRFLDLWHDKRPIKSPERELMKSMIEPEMHDEFSDSLVIPDSNFTAEERRDISMRLDLVTELGEALLAHLRSVYPADAGWQVTIVPNTHKTHTLDNIRALVAATSKETRAAIINSMKGGKRPGSVGDLIIREKFVLSIIGHGYNSKNELCLYPLETTEIQGTVLEESGLFGAIQKLKNDVEKAYAGARLIKVDPRDPTAPSNIELVHPAVMYPNLYNTIRYLQHTPKKKKR